MDVSIFDENHPVNSFCYSCVVFLFTNKTLKQSFPFEQHTLKPNAPILLTNGCVCDVFELLVMILPPL